MADALTLSELVRRTRTRLREWQQVPYCDGYGANTTAVHDTSASITDALNDICRELFDTGIKKCRFYQKVTSGTGEYAFDRDIHLTTYVTYRGAPLEKTSIEAMDGKWGTGWRTATGTPLKYYTFSNKLGLYPAPSATDGLADAPSIEILAETTLLPMANEADPLDTVIPIGLYSYLPDAAAELLLNSEGNSDAVERILPRLAARALKMRDLAATIARQRDEQETYQTRPLEYRSEAR